MTKYSIFHLLPAAMLLLLLAACAKAPAASEANTTTVSDGRVTIPVDSAQNAALSVAAVEARPAEIHRLNGRLTWDEDATVRIYTPVAGRIQSIDVALGDQVEKNGPLAHLNSPDFGQAQTDARKSDADLQLAERTLARTKDLFEHGAVAHKDLDAAESAYASARAEHQRATSRITLYGASPDGEVDELFTLRTPLAGVVVEKNINRGQEVRADQLLANAPQLFAPLFLISDPTRLGLLVDATEHDLPALRAGLPLVIRSTAFPGRQFEGKVEWVSNALDPATRMVTVRARVANPDRLLRAEMFVTIEFETADSPGLAVPSKAVFMKGEKHFVFVEEKPGTYLRREVEVGSEHDGKVVVLRGLESNQRIVAEGSLLLYQVQAEAGGS